MLTTTERNTSDTTHSSNENTPISLGKMMLTSNVVSAYLGKNAINEDRVPDLITQVYTTIEGLMNAGVPAQEIEDLAMKQVDDTPVEDEKEDVPQRPAVSIRASVQPDFLVCLEDGKKFRTLRKHLRVAYNMTPDEYRAKWKLPANYPMTAENYSVHRREIATKTGLGHHRWPVKGKAKVSPGRSPGRPRKMTNQSS